MRASRQVALWCILLLLLSGCAESEPPPVSAVEGLLARDPDLPRRWLRIPSEGSACTEFECPISPEGIDWGIETVAEQYEEDPIACEGSGTEVLRAWSNGGLPIANPTAFQSVCLYGTAAIAEEAFRSSVLPDAAGEDWFNLDPSFETPPRETVYPSAPATVPLMADEAETLCAEGYARGVCAVWMFRGRYGPATTSIQFIGSRGGITFASFSRLVASIDAELAASVKEPSPGSTVP